MNSLSNPPTGKLGEKRKRLFRQYGYDTKAACHALRLLDNLNFFLKSGHLKVYELSTGWRKLLTSVLGGMFQKHSIYNMFQEKLDTSKELLEKSTLPDNPDVDKINEFCIKTLRKYIYG